MKSFSDGVRFRGGFGICGFVVILEFVAVITGYLPFFSGMGGVMSWPV